MKNKISDLNNHLFAQIERLSDEGLTDTALGQEIERAKAVACISTQILNAANLSLQAEKLKREGLVGAAAADRLIGHGG